MGRTPNTFLFCTRSWASVRNWVRLDWSSCGTSSILRPLTPPWAFCRSKRATAPAKEPTDVDDATPVCEEMYPTLMVVGVTPTSLAVLGDEPAAPPLVPDGPAAGFAELLHPAAIKLTSAARTRMCDCLRSIGTTPFGRCP